MLVLFVVSIFVLTGITAIVVDISWYWANTLRVQRAADAAALAGVVWLPGAPGTAYTTARVEATKNGYKDGAGGVTVFPIKDAGNDRRLDVTISAPVSTYFMRIFGIRSIQAVRTSKAEFVLPVPMGSPEQWYGVGNYEVFSPGPPHVRGPQVPTNTAGPNTWTNAANGLTNNSAYATVGNTGLDAGLSRLRPERPGQRHGQRDRDPGRREVVRLGRLPARGVAVLGQRQELVDRAVRRPDQQRSAVAVALGRRTDDACGPATAGCPADFSNANFRVRVRGDDAGAVEPPAANCRSGATTSLDFFDVTVYSTGPGTSAATNLPTPAGEALAPTTQGFWGAVFTRGGVRRNGDRYSPEHFDPGVVNAEYAPEGYDYTIEFGADGGRVNLFDPVFCATGANASGSWYGAGDHWTTQSSSNSTPDPGGPVTTVFTLYDQNNTPYDPSDDIQVAQLVEGNQRQADQSGRVGSQNAGRAALPDCAERSAPQPVGPPGRLDDRPARPRCRPAVTGSTSTRARPATSTRAPRTCGRSTSATAARPAAPGSTAAAGWSATTTSPPTVATSASISPRSRQVHAGKTMVIELFDPGDVGQNAWIRVLSPDNNVYSYATFDYTADSVCVNGRSDSCAATGGPRSRRTGTGRAARSTTRSSRSRSRCRRLRAGTGWTRPATSPSEQGWWQIEYQVGQANDTTTWRVSIRGNPVHLVVPGDRRSRPSTLAAGTLGSRPEPDRSPPAPHPAGFAPALNRAGRRRPDRRSTDPGPPANRRQDPSSDRTGRDRSERRAGATERHRKGPKRGRM